MEVSAKFVSVWDGGNAISTNCTVELNTGKVLNIEPASDDESEQVEVFEGEFVEFDNTSYKIRLDEFNNEYYLTESSLDKFQDAVKQIM